MLTPDQIAYFETFGFLVLPQLFSVEETDALCGASLSTLQALRGVRPYTGEVEKVRNHIQAVLENKSEQNDHQEYVHVTLSCTTRRKYRSQGPATASPYLGADDYRSPVAIWQDGTCIQSWCTLPS